MTALIQLFLSVAFAASSIPQGVTVQGNILDRNGLPEEGASVAFTLQIVSPVPSSCVLYTETQTLNMQGSLGNFSLVLGQGARPSGTSFDARSTLSQIMSSNATFTGLQCANGTSYTSSFGDARNVALSFNDGNGVHSLSQSVSLQSVPFAYNADLVGGLAPSAFLNLGAGSLTQSNVENVFSSSNYSRLTSLLAGGMYEPLNANSTISIPSSSTTPNGVATGQVWYDPGTLSLKYYTGSVVQSVLTSATLDASALTHGTIGGSVAMNVTGNLQTAGSVSSSKSILYDHAGAGPGYIAIQSPANMAGAAYTMTLPLTAGSAGQALTTDGTGVLSWTTRVSSLTGAGPITIAGTPQIPVIGIVGASTTSPGVVQLAASGGTTAGTVVQAGDARLSDSRAPTGAASGDLAGTYPAPSVAKLRGVAVSAAPTTAGQVLRYDGSAWTPNFVSMSDLRSTITGAQSFTSGCTAGQTLTWTSATDNLSCTNIAVADSQVTFSPATAHTFFGGPISGSATPSYRALVAADLPSGAYDTSYFKISGNAVGAPLSVGTTDSYPLQLLSAGVARLTIGTGGNVGIGTTSPTAHLALAAGTATAGTSPLKFTSGTNLSTPESGAVEFDGTNLYFTDSTATRRTLAVSSGTPAFSGAVTMNGAGTGLTVTNNESIGGTLTVTGAVTVNGTTLSVTNNTSVGGTLAVTGAQTFTGASTFNGAQTINNSVTQAYTGTGTAHSITANSLTSGSMLSLSSNSTAAATGNTGASIAVSGANAAASITRTGLSSSVTSTGTTSMNVAAKFTASGASTNYGLLVTAGSVGIGNSTPTAQLDVTGHVANSGAAATAGTCGVSPSISGNDTRGTITVGTGVVTSCAITFNSAYATAPFCVASWSTTASATGIAVTSTTTALTVTFTASSPGAKVNYICMQ